MPSNQQSDKFVVEGNSLLVRGQLGIEDEKLYSEALFALLNSGNSELKIDFSALDYVSSSYIGATSLLVMMAKEKKLTPTLIVSEKVARIFKMAGLHHLVDIEIV